MQLRAPLRQAQSLERPALEAAVGHLKRRRGTHLWTSTSSWKWTWLCIDGNVYVLCTLMCTCMSMCLRIYIIYTYHIYTCRCNGVRRVRLSIACDCELRDRSNVTLSGVSVMISSDRSNIRSINIDMQHGWGLYTCSFLVNSIAQIIGQCSGSARA
jgi:hypothetical protein